MGNMGQTNPVVEEVNGSPGIHLVVYPVDGVEYYPGKVVARVDEVSHVNIGVLEPVKWCKMSVDKNSKSRKQFTPKTA